MRLRRLCLNTTVVDGIVALNDDQAKYLRKILRLGVGDDIELYDGTNRHIARLTKIDKHGAQVEIIRSTQIVRPGWDIRLAFSCVRPGPMEEIFRHCTELGVSRFLPFYSARTNRKPDLKKQRWINIIASAAGQCGQGLIPEVDDPGDLHDVVGSGLDDYTKILLSTSPASIPLIDALAQTGHYRLLLIIGPEGGFEDYEEELLRRTGCVAATICPSALRTETAAIVAVGIAAARFCGFEDADRGFSDLSA